MKSGALFRRGDIVEFKTYDGDDSELLKQYRVVLNLHPYKLVVMKKIDGNTVLVAVCKQTSKKNKEMFATNVGDVYVNTKCFYAISCLLIDECEIYFVNAQEAVSRIYDLHNQWTENCEKKREAEREKKQKQREKTKAKNAARKEIKAKEKEKERQYSRIYELAILNNDKKTMMEIEKDIGHAPSQSGKGYASSYKGKASNKCFNPKPLCGGRFSPK